MGDVYQQAGESQKAQKAYEKALEILETYKPEPRPDEVQRELNRIYSEFEQRVKERKTKEASK